MSFFVHESAYVDDGAIIGNGTKIWHFCHIMSGAQIGEDCVLGQNVFVGGRARIGNNVRIQNNVSVYDLVTLEDGVFCGPSMVFTNVLNPRAEIHRSIAEYRPTLVKRGASIGANATIVCGHTIGRYAFVGAGSVVTKDVPDYSLVYGNATKIAGWMCECGEKLRFGAGNPHDGDGITECAKCGKRYEKHGMSVDILHTRRPTLDTAGTEAGPYIQDRIFSIGKRSIRRNSIEREGGGLPLRSESGISSPSSNDF